MVYDILRNGTAPCLRETFCARGDYNVCNLRGCDTDLSIPKSKKEFLKRIYYRGAILIIYLMRLSMLLRFMLSRGYSKRTNTINIVS